MMFSTAAPKASTSHSPGGSLRNTTHCPSISRHCSGATMAKCGAGRAACAWRSGINAAVGQDARRESSRESPGYWVRDANQLEERERIGVVGVVLSLHVRAVKRQRRGE